MRLAIEAAEREGLIQYGDRVVITAGFPSGLAGTTNLVQVYSHATLLGRGRPRGEGLLWGILGRDILLLERLPKEPPPARVLLLREPLPRTATPPCPVVHQVRFYQEPREGEEITVNLDSGTIYRGRLRKRT